jgi:recombination associated protein RdgC
VIDSASPAKAEEFLEHLRKSLEGLPAKVLKVPVAIGGDDRLGRRRRSAGRLHPRSGPRTALGRESHRALRAKHSLEGEEIRQHIAAGKVVTRLAMTWNDRISFVLNDNLQVKRLAFLDILKEQADGQGDNEDERFDIDFTLMTGEVAQLLDDLLAALGGEPAAVWSAGSERSVSGSGRMPTSSRRSKTGCSARCGLR